jgi:hypothetical protein
LHAVIPTSTNHQPDDQAQLPMFHATKSGGNICSQSFSLIFGAASAGITASVLNRSPHFVQDQRLTTKRSLTNSDQSGETNTSLHLGQGVPRVVPIVDFSSVMKASPMCYPKI